MKHTRLAGKALDADLCVKGGPVGVGALKIVFDSALLGPEGEEKHIPVIDGEGSRCSQRKGMAHECGAEELDTHIEQPSYYDVVLKCDGELALDKCAGRGQSLVGGTDDARELRGRRRPIRRRS